MQDIPENSLYDPDAFCSMQSLVVEQPENSSLLNSWNSYNFRTLLLLENGADAKSVQKKMNAGFHKHADKSMAAMGMESNLLLKSYNEMYLEPFSSSSPPIVYVYIFPKLLLKVLDGMIQSEKP